MSELELTAIAFLAALLSVFYFIRRLPLHNVFGLLVVVVFVLWTRKYIATDFSSWLLWTLILTLNWFGLLVVRVMLTRSVSLRLLANLAQQQSAENFEQEIAGRLKDARAFHLVQITDQSYRLTMFGVFISTIVVVLYTLIRVKR
jgi:hypothetical protein